MHSWSSSAASRRVHQNVDEMNDHNFRRELIDLAENARAEAIGVAMYDYEQRTGWSVHGDEWFHAASTIKVPVLLGVFDAIDQGRLELHSRVHVRNRFLSIADGSMYRVEGGRDANSAVHAAVGKMLTVQELSHHMITTSSNLATNLLLEVVGLESIQQTLRDLKLDGIELVRGVEDIVAWEKGINNRVTANGLLRALRSIEEKRAISREASDHMLEILHAQEFRRGIPAGLPEGVRVANKTGEMSTVAHDAGLVYIEGRKPYALVILTEWEANAGKRQEMIASVSRAVYGLIAEEKTNA